MLRAYELAHDHLHTHPNPRVGAVVVDTDDRVVGEGFHRGPGTSHAEVAALVDAAEEARGSTVFVSLEPCNHTGFTGPCTEALIAADVQSVVIGVADPDPQVSGSGIERLREAGIDVTVLDDPLARQVDLAYFRHRETGMPLVTLKWAMTLDGSVAAADGSSQWITGELARRNVHDLRASSDAVVIGAGTLRADDPLLDVRIPGYDGHQPRPVVVAGAEDLPFDARIWKRDPLVVSTHERDLPGGELVAVPGDNNRPDPAETAKELARRGLLQILMEGGPTLAGEWWRSGVVTNGLVWIGSKLGGGVGRPPIDGLFESIDDASPVKIHDSRIVDGDVVIAFERI